MSFVFPVYVAWSDSLMIFFLQQSQFSCCDVYIKKLTLIHLSYKMSFSFLKMQTSLKGFHLVVIFFIVLKL